MFSVFGAELPLQKLWSGENAAYKNHGLDKTALAFSISGEELVLRFLCLAQSRPYVFCIRRRIALTNSMLRRNSGLRLLYLKIVKLYVSPEIAKLLFL